MRDSIVGKPLMSGFLGDDFVILAPRMGKILNFE
jgi:hypothetical protein